MFLEDSVDFSVILFLMTHRLPFLILLSVICLPAQVSYLLSAAPTFAQETTPVVTSNSTVNPQETGNAWDDFLKNLIPFQFKQIPDTLERVNCSNLPSEACTSMESTAVQTEKDKTLSVKPQANDEGEKEKIVSDTAGQYTIASGVNTPPEVSNASTNIAGMFAGIMNLFDQIFARGNREAQNFANVVLPQDGANNISDARGNTAMDQALPLRQCAQLPAKLCDADNKLKIQNQQ